MKTSRPKTHRARARQIAHALPAAEQRALLGRGGPVRGAVLDSLVSRGLLIRTDWNRWNRTPLGETVRKELSQ